MAPEVAGAPEAALHLVKHQDRARFRADLLQPGEERLVRGEDAALALHGLNKHRRGFTFDDCLLSRFEIPVGGEGVAR